MGFRFAIASDLHIGLPHTIWQHPNRFHLIEYSIPAFEAILSHLAHQDIDFLLLPGDLTQHGEPDNHRWLADRLSQLPYPTYVIPGNHDIPTPESMDAFPSYYRQFGYQATDALYFDRQILPGVRLIGLNSSTFDTAGKQIGWVDDAQLAWLQATLSKNDDLLFVTIHHNILEHLPGQADNPLGRRYLLENHTALCEVLHRAGVQLVFTGHLHVQDVAYSDCWRLYDICTGSTVSYPHPYRLLTYDDGQLTIQSYRIESLPDRTDLQDFSREWMGDRCHPFVMKLMTHPPLSLEVTLAESFVPHLRYFWATLADGDAQFAFPELPSPAREYFEAFSDSPPADNHLTVAIQTPVRTRHA